MLICSRRTPAEYILSLESFFFCIHMKSLLKANRGVSPEKTAGRVCFLVVWWVYVEHRQESG